MYCVGHQGSKTSTSKEWLDFVKPREAIISVGDNKFGHPSKDVLDRLTLSNVEIRRTDVESDVSY